MAKIDINFNNTNYTIDEASLSTASAALRNHLSTVMSGTGAVINLGGTSYNIDSTKLTTATNAFVSHLSKIAGSGSKVTVGGVEYSVGSDKLSGAVAELEAVLGELNSGEGSATNTVEWDGSPEGKQIYEFYNPDDTEYLLFKGVKVSDATPQLVSVDDGSIIVNGVLSMKEINNNSGEETVYEDIDIQACHAEAIYNGEELFGVYLVLVGGNMGRPIIAVLYENYGSIPNGTYLCYNTNISSGMGANIDAYGLKVTLTEPLF